MATLSCDLIAQGRAPFTALYIYGPSESGKTALLNYLESEVYKMNPTKLIGRANASELNDADWSARNDLITIAENCDIFIMDDFQCLNTCTYALQDLQSLIDKMHLAGTKFVFAGNKPLDAYPEIACTDFFSRMAWEMQAKLVPANYDDYMNALAEVAAGLGKYDSGELNKIFNMIVKAEGCNLGSALGTFRRIVVRSEMNNVPLSYDFALDVVYDGAEIELIA